MSAAAKPTMHIVIIAVWVSLVGASVAPLQATTPIDVPSWATFPEALGDFKRDPSRDLAQYAILARYTREAAFRDRKSDVEGTIAFVRALLRAVLKGKQVLHPASGARSDTALLLP